MERWVEKALIIPPPRTRTHALLPIDLPPAAEHKCVCRAIFTITTASPRWIESSARGRQGVFTSWIGGSGRDDCAPLLCLAFLVFCFFCFFCICQGGREGERERGRATTAEQRTHGTFSKKSFVLVFFCFDRSMNDATDVRIWPRFDTASQARLSIVYFRHTRARGDSAKAY